MQNAFEEIRQQIHEIRNILGPVDIKLDNLDHKITASRMTFESKFSDLDTKIAANTSRLSEHELKISGHSDEMAQQSERIRQIEMFLKMPRNPAPVHEDKAKPSVIPPPPPPPAAPA